MTDVAIRVKGLSKQYRIGPRESYKTLRESLTNVFTAPFNRKNLQSAIRNPQSNHPPSSISHPSDFRQSSILHPSSSIKDNYVWALKDVSFEVKHGEVIGIIGPNGAGKTTLLKILSRITEPTEGNVELTGRVGSLLEVGTGFHAELTGRENIYLNGAILGMSKAEINIKFDDIVAFAEIEKFLDTPVKHYSTGMGTRLAFAIAAHLEPEILLVDEVLSVGDMAFRKKCLGKMQDVSQEGRTVLFVSHEMNAIRRLCKNGLWLDKGKMQAIGPAVDVVRKYEESVLTSNNIRTSRAERDKPPNSSKYFSWVSLSSADGQPATVFRFGDVIRLAVGMEGRTPDHTHFVQWFLNESSQGNRVAWGSTDILPEGDMQGDSNEISFLIGPLPLAQGQYLFSVAMGVGGVIDLDFWHDAIAFEVLESDPDNSGYHYTTRLAPTVIAYRIG
jgi:lipopolysaccharide transport system ATP-binding protein